MRYDQEPDDDFATSMGAAPREVNDDEDDEGSMPPRLEPSRALMGYAPERHDGPRRGRRR